MGILSTGQGGRTEPLRGTKFWKSRNITGQKFGKLLVLGYEIVKGYTRWICLCDCGVYRSVEYARLNDGSAKCCQVCTKEKRIKRFREHTLAKKKTLPHWFTLRSRWNGMMTRCHRQYRCPQQTWANYGGRGISVCREWRENFLAFYEWSMANGFLKELSIDRINNDGNYEPSNCRYADSKTQMANRRNTVFVNLNGEKRLLTEVVDELPIKEGALRLRMYKGVPESELLNPNGCVTHIRKTPLFSFEYNGVKMTVAEASRETGLNHSTILWRARKGWPSDRILSPSRVIGCKYKQPDGRYKAKTTTQHPVETPQ